MNAEDAQWRELDRRADLTVLRREVEFWGADLVLRQLQSKDAKWTDRELRGDWVLEELERAQEISAGILDLPDFRDDREAHLLPLRLAYLEQLVTARRTAQAAYQAFRAGVEWHRVQEHVLKVHDLELDAKPGRRFKAAARRGGRGRRGYRKRTEDEIREAWSRTRERYPGDKLVGIDKRVAAHLGIGERTVRRYRAGARVQVSVRKSPRQGNSNPVAH